MIPLTVHELHQHGLINRDFQYKVTPIEKAGEGLSMPQKVDQMVEAMGLTPGGALVPRVRELITMFGLDAGATPKILAEQVDMMFNIIVDVPPQSLSEI